jgi:hypothetical protein
MMGSSRRSEDKKEEKKLERREAGRNPARLPITRAAHLFLALPARGAFEDQVETRWNIADIGDPRMPYKFTTKWCTKHIAQGEH